MGDSSMILLVISPLARAPFGTATMYSHYNVLATIEDGLGLPRMGSSVGAMPLAEMFH